jgi:hypothetical protein
MHDTTMKPAFAVVHSARPARRASVAKSGRIASAKVEAFAREFTPKFKQPLCDAVGELLKLRGRA